MLNDLRREAERNGPVGDEPSDHADADEVRRLEEELRATKARIAEDKEKMTAGCLSLPNAPLLSFFLKTNADADDGCVRAEAAACGECDGARHGCGHRCAT